MHDERASTRLPEAHQSQDDASVTKAPPLPCARRRSRARIWEGQVARRARRARARRGWATPALDKGEEREAIFEIASEGGAAAGAGAGAGAGTTNTDTQPPPKGDTDPGDEHPHKKSSLRTVGLITSGAVAAVGLGVGVGFLMAKSSASSDADSIQGDNHLGASTCYGSPRPAACNDLADANDRGKRDATISTIGFIGAGVGVAGLVTFLLLPESKQTATTIHPLIGQHTVGLGAYGQF